MKDPDWDKIKFLPVADKADVLALRDGDFVCTEDPRGWEWRVGWKGNRKYRQRIKA